MPYLCPGNFFNANADLSVDKLTLLWIVESNASTNTEVFEVCLYVIIQVKHDEDFIARSVANQKARSEQRAVLHDLADKDPVMRRRIVSGSIRPKASVQGVLPREVVPIREVALCRQTVTPKIGE